KDKLRAAARRFRPEDFFRFDPAKQPVPIDIPKKCDQCEGTNLPAARQCRDCGAALKMTSPYDILCDALITTYFGDRYGVQLGASLAEVTQWIPRDSDRCGIRHVAAERGWRLGTCQFD